nr:putative alpha/beta hydrolase fold protein [Tanacetum cinerariifolium]
MSIEGETDWLRRSKLQNGQIGKYAKVTFSKTKKKGGEHKEAIVNSIRVAVEPYNSIYVFSFENMRNLISLSGSESSLNPPAELKKFAVVAVSSTEKCWSMMKETEVVKNVLRFWVEREGLGGLSFVALGASSGGYFVSMLASKMRFSSIVVMIAEGVFDRIDVGKDYPATLFVHMPKDKARKKMIGENIGVMRREGVDVAEVEWFVNKQGYLVNDGRVLPWKEAMNERRISLPNKLLVNYIQEELNVAYAYHEMTSLQNEQIFDWFESHLR